MRVRPAAWCLIVVSGSAALAVSGCRADRPEFAMRDAALDLMAETRPFLLRIDGRQRHEACIARDSTAALGALRCRGSMSADDLARAADLAGRVSRASGVSRSGTGASETDALWASALLDLWTAPDDPRTLDRAVARLEAVRIRRADDADAALHLAVARSARAAATDDPRDLFLAMDLVEQAVSLAPDDIVPRFDRALLLAQVHADSTAVRTLEWLFARERAPPWRAEAETLRARIAERSAWRRVDPTTLPTLELADSQGAREWVMDSLLPRWAAARSAGDRGSEREIATTVQSIGARLAATHGDSTVPRIARDLRRLGADDGRSRAVALYVEGVREYAATEHEAALPLLEQATRAADRAGAPAIAAWARLAHAGALWSRERFDEARAAVHQVQRSAAQSQSVALGARADWLASLIAARTAELGAALPPLGRGDSAFRSIGEFGNAAFLRAIRSEILAYAGQPRESARDAFDGLVMPARIRRAPRFEQWLTLSDRLLTLDAPHAAAVALDEAAIRARRGDRAKDLPETLARMASVQLALGRRPEALASLTEGRAALPGITDASMRRRTTAELDRAESLVRSASAPESALVLLERARATLDTIPLHRAELLARRGAIRLAAGDTNGARVDLAGALELAEQRARTTAGTERRSARRTLRDAQRRLASLSLAVGDTVSALRFARALTATSEPSAFGAPGRTPGRAPIRLTVVALPELVLAWTESATGTSVRAEPIPASDLATMVRQLRSLVRSGVDPSSERAVAARLFASLVGAHADGIAAAARVEIASDEVLGDLPFAALRSADGRHLAEIAAIAVLAPVEQRNGAAARNPARRGLLLVSDPAWDRREHPDLDPLPWAAREASAIAALDPTALALGGADATGGALRRALATAASLHFAGHAVVEDGSDGRSHLVLAPDVEGRAARMTAREFEALDLRGLRLAVLSACGRTSGNAVPTEPVNELVRALLSAGTETVVAGLWEVEDAAMASVMEWLHRERVAGADAAEALRRAQRRALAGSAAERRAAFTMVAYVGAERR